MRDEDVAGAGQGRSSSPRNRMPCNSSEEGLDDWASTICQALPQGPG